MDYCPTCGSSHNLEILDKERIRCNECKRIIEKGQLLVNVDEAHLRWVDYLHKLANGLIERPVEEKDKWRQ